MRNLLPNELWQNIYSFDDTYRKYFQEHVLVYIHPYAVYRVVDRPLVIIVDPSRDEVHLTDNMETPLFVSTSYHRPPSRYLELFRVSQSKPMRRSLLESILHYDFTKA